MNSSILVSAPRMLSGCGHHDAIKHRIAESTARLTPKPFNPHKSRRTVNPVFLKVEWVPVIVDKGIAAKVDDTCFFGFDVVSSGGGSC
jgi:hypothetical protein